MPGFLLHAGATVLCDHGGLALPAATNPRVVVLGEPTVVLATPYVIDGCALPPPPPGTGPCRSARFLAGSVRVTSMGKPLLLATSPARCEPTGTPLVVVTTQTRVVAV